jgi:hypothetical protein
MGGLLTSYELVSCTRLGTRCTPSKLAANSAVHIFSVITPLVGHQRRREMADGRQRNDRRDESRDPAAQEHPDKFAAASGRDDDPRLDRGDREDAARDRDGGGVVSADATAVSRDDGSIVFHTSRDNSESSPESEQHSEGGSGIDVFGATAPGGPADYLGMQVDSEREHILRPQDLVALAGDGATPGMQGESLQGQQGAVDIGFNRGSVVASPRDDERTIGEDDSPLGSQRDSIHGGPGGDRPGSIWDNPNVVGEDKEQMLQEAADPDLTGLVDMDGIVSGTPGSTIDGRTPDGAGFGIGENPAGVGGSGWSGSISPEGTNASGTYTAPALTNPFKAAEVIEKGKADFGAGNFFVHDAATGKQIYGPGTSQGGVTISPKGKPGEYVVTPVPSGESGGSDASAGDSTGRGTDSGSTSGSTTGSGSSPLAPPVKYSESDGVKATGTSSYADNELARGASELITTGPPGSTKNEALKQAIQAIDDEFAPKTDMPSDPDAGQPPPGLDLSKEWAIQVWARQNADINPNPNDGQGAGSGAVMDIGDFVKQYDDAIVEANVDAAAMIDKYNQDSLGEQFGEVDE